MGLFDFFRRKPPIRDAAGLSGFIDENAAFLVQKGIYEYSRARAGHYSKVLFREPEFHAALERSRWSAYPLGLAMVAEIADAALLTLAGENERSARLRAIGALTLSVFDRYPVPAALTPDIWRELRTELVRRLQLIGLHQRKAAMDIPEQFAERYFALMPIHEKLRGRDFTTTRNYLRVTALNIHDELSKRVDVIPLSAALSALTPAHATAVEPDHENVS